MAQETTEKPFDEKAKRKFRRLITRARAALVWERFWPRALPVLCVAGAFLTMSFGGVWGALSPILRMTGVALFGSAVAATSLIGKTKTIFVSKNDAIKRLDNNLGITLENNTTPARTLASKVSDHSSDLEKNLWTVHLDRIWKYYGSAFEVGKPKPQNGYLKSAVSALALTTVFTAIMAGEDRMSRLKEAFNWQALPTVLDEPTEKSLVPLQIQAWITPPDGIDKDAIYFTDADDSVDILDVHTQSVISLRIDGVSPKVLIDGEILEPEKVSKKFRAYSDDDLPDISVYQYRFIFDQDKAQNHRLSILNGDVLAGEWNFDIETDLAPVVEIYDIQINDENPEALKIEYAAKDDFGLEKVEVELQAPVSSDAKAKPLNAAKLPTFILP